MIRITTVCLVFSLVSCLAFGQSELAYLNAKSPTLSTTNIAASYIPFSLHKGKIFIHAEVDGQKGNFILDTGAPGIILNQKSEKQSAIKATGATGDINLGIVQVNSFKLGHVNINDFKAYSIDISHLEKANDRSILGLVGFDMLANFEVLFDFKQNLLVLLPAHQNQLHKDKKAVAAWPFTLEGHLPVVRMKVGKQKLNMGIDSGAQDNILAEELYSKIPKQLIGKKGKMELRGLDGQIDLVKTAFVNDATLKSHELPTMKYLFADLSAINDSSDTRIDGLLGFSFFEGQTISINYANRKIYLW